MWRQKGPRADKESVGGLQVPLHSHGSNETTSFSGAKHRSWGIKLSTQERRDSFCYFYKNRWKKRLFFSTRCRMWTSLALCIIGSFFQRSESSGTLCVVVVVGCIAHGAYKAKFSSLERVASLQRNCLEIHPPVNGSNPGTQNEVFHITHCYLILLKWEGFFNNQSFKQNPMFQKNRAISLSGAYQFSSCLSSYAFVNDHQGMGPELCWMWSSFLIRLIIAYCAMKLK